MAPSLDVLLQRPIDALLADADAAGLPRRRHAWRDGLAAALAAHHGREDFGCGILEVHAEGFGFLRSPYDDLLPGPDDIYVSQSQIKRFALRTGDTVIGRIRPPKESERYAALLRVDAINGEPADVEVVPFDAHDAVHPTTRLPLARDPWLAVVDWVAPLGLGARGVVHGDGRSDRTELLRRLAGAFASDPRFTVSVVLPGERPEEVTAWREEVGAEVLATALDETPSRHLDVVEIAAERARRLAERGGLVLLVVDSLSRLVRHALAGTAPSGHVVDGIDASALARVKRLLATGRDLRDAGSVTLVTTLDRTPDDPVSAALHREVADLVNWHVALRPQPGGSRPAVDAPRCWTRHEHLLVPADELDRRARWRQRVGDDPAATDEALGELFRAAAS